MSDKLMFENQSINQSFDQPKHINTASYFANESEAQQSIFFYCCNNKAFNGFISCSVSPLLDTLRRAQIARNELN